MRCRPCSSYIANTASQGRCGVGYTQEYCNRVRQDCRRIGRLTDRESTVDVLGQARGVSREARRFRRPRRHLFSTFEGHLPCRFPAFDVDVANLVTDRPVSREKKGKPLLFCVFCKGIKAFDTASGYWGHLVHKHDGIDTSHRLNEIRRTASE